MTFAGDFGVAPGFAQDFMQRLIAVSGFMVEHAVVLDSCTKAEIDTHDIARMSPVLLRGHHLIQRILRVKNDEIRVTIEFKWLGFRFPIEAYARRQWNRPRPYRAAQSDSRRSPRDEAAALT